MSATGYLDACGFTPVSSGTGSFVVSAAIVGYQTPASAGAVNTTVYSYRAESNDKTQWEEGFGAYTVSTTTLARTTITANSSGGTSAISFSVAPNVFITALSQDLQNAGLLKGSYSGFINKLRNSSLIAWFHGSGSLTITTAGAWGAEGLFIVPTGASVTAVQIANGLSAPLTFWAQKITGATSVTDVKVRFVIESYDAAPLAGNQVTFQVPVLNNTGATITPTITVKHAGAQDNFGTPTTDVSAVSLQAITNGSTGVLAYSWAAPAGSNNGISIDIDFGNNFTANTKSIQIGGGFDCRATPGVPTGTVAAPPVPEIPTAQEDMLWNQRFYATSYSNGVAPGTATALGMTGPGSLFISAVFGSQGIITFPTELRAVPSISTFDAAGTASKCTSYPSSSSTPTNGGTITLAPYNISTKTASWEGQAAASGVSFVHYTADVTITGA